MCNQVTLTPQTDGCLGKMKLIIVYKGSHQETNLLVEGEVIDKEIVIVVSICDSKTQPGRALGFLTLCMLTCSIGAECLGVEVAVL